MIKLYKGDTLIAIENRISEDYFELVTVGSGLQVPYVLFWDDYEGTCPMERFIKWLEFRAIPETRVNIDEVLERIGLKEYDALEIMKYFKGRFFNDDYWVEGL